MMTLAHGTPAQHKMAQESLNRWWWPSMMMFGPNDDASPHSAQSMRWKIKRYSNDDLRQKFVDVMAEQAAVLGLTIPDPDMHWNADRGHYDFGTIDWKEFDEILRGNGPCNKERLDARNKAWNDGAWVREAATAFAAKRKSATA
jgi:ring-1,2-phenylacetyl-CoA epoxidase subunit PaaA